MQANHQRQVEGITKATDDLAQAKSFGKQLHLGKILDYSKRLFKSIEGVEEVYRLIAKLDKGGVFSGTDWDSPERLQPSFSVKSFESNVSKLVVIEGLNLLRMLAIKQGDHFHIDISDDRAGYYLQKVVALNLKYVTGQSTESLRNNSHSALISNLLQFSLKQMGHKEIIDQLIAEVWRILDQRPLMVKTPIEMILNIGQYWLEGKIESEKTQEAAKELISALYGPTPLTIHDPGLSSYCEILKECDHEKLSTEAKHFSEKMHKTGLVSSYHAIFLRFLHDNHPNLISEALGLSQTGNDAFYCYQDLMMTLIDKVIFPETSQAVYGLSRLLERGILYRPSLPPYLWRQINLELSDQAQEVLSACFGRELPANIHLLAGTINMLGLPLGVGQGDNPTCQSARALFMWSYSDPDYLLHFITRAARDNEIVMHFEGERLSTKNLSDIPNKKYNWDLDPVSTLLVPHLDKLYYHMSLLSAQRGEDIHKWVNPELHGWWVGRGFSIAVDIATGMLKDFESFVRRFYATYNPYYNGNRPVIFPQPAGLAVTDSHGRFIGWHAVAIIRVNLDPQNVMRIYFFNPNNDSGQDWGNGVVVSTRGHGEYQGESSLPFSEFCSRLYIFHYDLLEYQSVDLEKIDQKEVQETIMMATKSWAADR